MPSSMTHRQRALAVLRYQPYDRLPLVHFGFWKNPPDRDDTLKRWAREGHISTEMARGWGDGNEIDRELTRRLGFDFNWQNCFHPETGLRPGFKWEVVREFPDGSQHIRDGGGVTHLRKPSAGSIPAEIEHLLKDRASYEEHYKWRLQWSPDRVLKAKVRSGAQWLPFDEGGADCLQKSEWDWPLGLHCGSLFGTIRNIIGLENVCYMMADDPELLAEIIDTFAGLSYQAVKMTLESGARFDFAHFWEDICYKNGPLVTPSFFAETVGPHYKRVTDLCRQHGIDIVSLDCDGMIDALLPIWLENGVNTMFPIEVGTWHASIAPWRAKYGQALRGVGGMDKRVFAHDRAAVDAEIERLKPLVELGGYIPCPDHRLAPDAQWDLVCYYCERMRKVFG